MAYDDLEPPQMTAMGRVIVALVVAIITLIIVGVLM